MKLPTASESMGARPEPSPSLGIARYQPVTGSEDIEAKAVGQLGKSLGEISDILYKEQERVDRLRAEDAFNQLLEAKTNLTVGEKYGFVNYKGGDAISRPLLQQYNSRMDGHINEISGKLANDQQRQFFRRRADIARLQLREDVQKHQFNEGQKFETTTIENATRLELQNIQSRPTEPQVYEMAAARLNGIINGSSFGPEQKELMRSKMLTAAHTTVIENALASGNDLYAKQWYKDHQKEIYDPEGTLKKKVETNSSIIEAGRAVDTIWAKKGPRSDEAPLDMAAMDAELRKQYADNPTILKAARAEMEMRANLRNHAVKERENFHLSTVSKLIDGGGDMAAVRQSKSFQSLDGVQQLRVIDYLKQRSKGVEGITMDQFRSYQELSKPEVLDKMSTEAVESLVFNLGNELTDRLLKKKELYGKEPEAKVDADDLNHFLREAGVDVEDKDNKGRIGELRYNIENIVNAEQNNKTRKLTREEKNKIIQEQTLKVLLRREFWTDPERLMAEVKPEEFAKAYVPIDKIAPTDQVILRKRAAELGVTITDKQIEHAMFLRRRGANGAAIDQYLRGKL